MLRRVTCVFQRGGRPMMETEYAFPEELPADWWDRKFTDRPEWLLDPRRFGISTKEAA